MSSKKLKTLEPCLNCDVCGIIVDAATNAPLHIGDWPQPEWSINETLNTVTYKGFPVSLRVANPDDVPSLLANRKIFAPPDGPDTLPKLVEEFTNFRGLSYPYVCIAKVDNQVVGKLFLDRNPKNAILRHLNAAVIDNVAMDSDFGDRGIADKLLEFAEQIAKKNGTRWMEIGVKRVEDQADTADARRGTDSLRLYLRRGYHAEALYLNKEIDIHYRVENLPGAATIRNPRYGKALVVYKDLNSDFRYSENKRKKIYDKLLAGIPV